ncbi:hypothetical protein B0T25DRAFT_563049 [Lasiosphaeria hispida]|uniref:Uncharacterized protein n=1 Tax=Lasiosphaeria hispida TaxID=260671 RepID=A0AAJ0HWE4_9PEZI|nr:hypothetical protein B0T25DRAFT_563049 [Lasiosphaeria hispida]
MNRNGDDDIELGFQRGVERDSESANFWSPAQRNCFVNSFVLFLSVILYMVLFIANMIGCFFRLTLNGESFIPGLAHAIKKLLGGLYKAIKKLVHGFVYGLGRGIRDLVHGLGKGIRDLIYGLGRGIRDLVHGIRDLVYGLSRGIRDLCWAALVLLAIFLAIFLIVLYTMPEDRFQLIISILNSTHTTTSPM